MPSQPELTVNRVRYKSGGALGTVVEVASDKELRERFGLGGDLPEGYFARVAWDHAQDQQRDGPRVPEESFTHLTLLEVVTS